MRLKKYENLRLLRSCTHVKIIELTEKISKLSQSQEQFLHENPDLNLFISGIYRSQHEDENISNDTPIPESELIKTDLTDFKNYNPDKDFENDFKTYYHRSVQIKNFSKALEEYRTFADKLYGSPMQTANIKDFLDTTKTKHTPSFRRFAKGIQAHSPMHLGYTYKKLAETIAERNKIKDKEYTTKADRAFNLKRTTLSLNRDFKGRLKNNGIKLALAGALSVVLLAGYTMFNGDITVSHGSNTPHVSGTVLENNGDISQVSQPAPEAEQSSIFTNSITNMSTYEDACKDYFEKISDIYRYNTGDEIDLSGYGQSQIGYSSSANIFIVELNGKTYTISGQGHSAPNYRYLQQALEATGAKVTPTTSSLSCIIDKNDSNRSIAITDSVGNPVRSGIVLSGSNNAYIQSYIDAGSEILEAQGKTNCSEAECVGTYLLSDAHELDPELCRALGEVQNLTYFIKSTFYEKQDGKSDPYAVSIYGQKSQKLAQSFENRANSQQEQTQSTNSKELDER